MTKREALSRREFLQTGFVTSLVLSGGVWFQENGYANLQTRNPDLSFFTHAETMILTALLPVAASSSLSIKEQLSVLDTTVSALPVHIRSEIRQLFFVLDLFPLRWLGFAGFVSWSEASNVDVERMLSFLRDSRLTLLNVIYGALVELILGALYSDRRSWESIGYPGPSFEPEVVK